MKRAVTFISGLSILLAGVSMPAAQARMRVSVDRQGYSYFDENRTTPFNIASLAYRGAFKDQGIPGYVRLLQAYNLGRVTAEDIVETAVNNGVLSSEVLEDDGYIRAVDMHLDATISR